MKKAILFVFSILLGTTAITAQNIADVFKKVPESVVYGISDEDKAFLVANTSDSLATIVPSSIYVGVERLAASDDYLSFKTSAAGTTQIKLLPLVNGSKVVCVVKTVCGKICDSDIRFYTTEWSPIDAGALFPAFNPDWFLKADVDKDSQTYKNAVSVIDMNPCKIILSSSGDEAGVEYQIKNYLSKEDYEILAPYLLDEVKILKWDKMSFK